MSASAATPMADEDIYAFRPVPEASGAAVKPKKPRRLWPWVLCGAALMLVLVAVTGTALLATVLDSSREGMNISINGEHWQPDFIDTDHGVLALLGVAAALVVVLVVVPVVVVLSLAVGLMGAALGLGVALLAVLLIVGVATSPLWLFGLLLWLALRRRPAVAA